MTEVHKHEELVRAQMNGWLELLRKSKFVLHDFGWVRTYVPESRDEQEVNK